MPSNVLAYIGDSVYELYSRLAVISGPEVRMKGIHRRNVSAVNAGAQAAAARRILDFLTEEESAIYRRGRNANTGTMARNASAADYRVASGIESLIGYLFLAGRDDRLSEILGKLFQDPGAGDPGDAGDTAGTER